MAAVYSTRLLQAVGLTADLVYTVPPGFVAIVRDADLHNNDTFGASFFMQGALGQAIWLATRDITDTGYYSWRGRQVLEAGETLTAHIASGTWDVTISGYLLSAAA